MAQLFRHKVRTPRVALACKDSEDGVWKEAYDLEIERNALLRDQLQSQGLKSLLLDDESPELSGEPDACAVDWEQSYEKLAACNSALEAQLRGGGGAARAESVGEKTEGTEVSAAPGPAKLEVRIAGQDVSETIELSRFFGGAGAFYAVQARLPLGLNITKRDSGKLLGAFVVENVMPGGAAEAGGEILAGDVLQALTVIMDSSDMGMKTEDFVSSVVGGMGRWRQALTDATFIDSVDDLVEAIKSNTVISSDTQLTLVFERDAAALPPPREPLRPVEAA